MNEKIVALSLGSKNIAAAIGIDNSGELELIETITRPSKGISKGKIIDKVLVTESIVEVLEELSKRSSERINSVYIGVSTKNSSFSTTKGVAILDDTNPINKIDMTRAYVDGKGTSDKIDGLIRYVHLDGDKQEENPIGKTGISLEIDMDLVALDTEFVDTVSEIFSTINCQIKGYLLELESIDRIFVPSKNDNHLIIEFGAEKSDFAYYEAGRLRYAKSIDLGGQIITKDLSIVTGIDEAKVEDIKKQYSQEYNTLRNDFRKLEIEDGKILDSNLFYEVINARIEEISEYIKKDLGNSDIYDKINYIYVFGDSLTMFENIGMFLEDTFSKKVKIFTKDDINVENSSIIAPIAIVKEAYDRLKLLSDNNFNNEELIESQEDIQKDQGLEKEENKKAKKRGLSKVFGFLGDIF